MASSAGQWLARVGRAIAARVNGFVAWMTNLGGTRPYHSRLGDLVDSSEGHGPSDPVEDEHAAERGELRD